MRIGIFGKPKIEAIMTFLKNYVLFQNKQTNRICYEEKGGAEMGIKDSTAHTKLI